MRVTNQNIRCKGRIEEEKDDKNDQRQKGAIRARYSGTMNSRLGIGAPQLLPVKHKNKNKKTDLANR
jgi:hypothetical protein